MCLSVLGVRLGQYDVRLAGWLASWAEASGWGMTRDYDTSCEVRSAPGRLGGGRGVVGLEDRDEEM